jgi:CheY-like chemotaxis protein
VKILVVEDSMAIRRDNERVLIKAGYEVICAEDGPSALLMAREQRPDLILLDLMLPKMTGTVVLRCLKENPLTASIPVVVVSGLSERNREKLLEEGAEEYLEKNTLMPRPGENLLPRILEDVICRINRKRGIMFTTVPIRH